MKRLTVATGALAGLLTLGMTGALILAPSAGATTRFLTDGTHATRAISSISSVRDTYVKRHGLTTEPGGSPPVSAQPARRGIVVGPRCMMRMQDEGSAT